MICFRRHQDHRRRRCFSLFSHQCKFTQDLRVFSKAKKKPTRSGLKQRRKVAILAANGKSNPEIARELSLTEQRIKQIMAEPEVQAMEAHFSISVDKQRMAAESIFLDTAVERTAAGDIAWAALLEQRITNAEKRGGVAGAQVQVNVNQGISTSFEDLVRSVAVVPGE